MINPIFQSRMALKFTLIYLIVAIALQLYFTSRLNEHKENFSRIFPVTTEQHLVLHDMITQAILFMTFVSLIGAFCIIGLAISYSHKIAGPIYVIRQNIQKMLDNNFNIRTNFRDGDEFSELAHDINLLAEKFKENNKN